MPASNEILQSLEHTLTLDPVVILDNESGNNNQGDIQPSKIIGAMYPFIEINKYEFQYDSIVSFQLNNTGFLPTLNLKVVDSDRLFQSRHYALDGAVINFYIRANNEELFKPIHINFDIINISPAGISPAGKPMFNMLGQMKVPNLYTEYCLAYPEMNSFDALLTIAEELQLGFASNEETTEDIMTWINPYDTYLKFIQDITANIYKDEESFFTTYIDPYYNLTLVNYNKEQEINETEIYSTQMTDLYQREDTEFDALPLFYTNYRAFNNTSRFITSYRLINRTGEVFLENGYKRIFQYYDSIENEYISDVEVEALTGTDESKIHLRGRYINGESEGLQDQYIKYKYMGKQNENMHDYYLYSNILNYQNKKETNKINMEITLYQTDMSIYRYQAVIIQIFEYETMVKKIMSANGGDSEGSSEDSDDSPEPILNEFLSGAYIITGIEYVYRNPGPMYQRLTLAKREFSPPQ